MKRSPLKPGKPLQRKTPMGRGSSELKRTPMRQSATTKSGKPARVKPVSEAQKKTNAAYKKARNRFMEENPFCEFPDCGRPSTDCHHVRSRGTTPDLRTDEKNFSSLCAAHHKQITEDPGLGYRLGLMKKSDYELRLNERRAE